MKKPTFSLFSMLTILFLGFMLGFFLGRNHRSSDIVLSGITVSEPPRSISGTEGTTAEAAEIFPININAADMDDFMTIPGIGEVMARRILEYRDANGAFETVYELLNVKGIGEQTLDSILDYITTGGYRQ